MTEVDVPPLDVVVVGGGINGAGLARDAAGRGLSVALLEKGDLGEGTSSRSGKYIHGGLRYLEYYEFRLVREALKEREVVLGIAPHLTWPLQLILPHSAEQRPRWLIRLGLFLYDHLGGRQGIPGTRSVDLHSAPEGKTVRKRFRHAFSYHDVWVDDARLVLLNALDAARRGAEVLPRTRFVAAERDGNLWKITWRDELAGVSTVRHARALINAAGPWVENVIREVPRLQSQHHVRLVKGSHIIVKRWWQGEHGYVLQNTDRRLIFVNPYCDDLALIGTTDIPWEGRAEDVAIDAEETTYLLDVLNRYFDVSLTESAIVHTYSGVRPLYDDDSNKNASAVTRDYTFELDGKVGEAPALSVFGGKLTTYRRLSEHGLGKLRQWFPQMGGDWTAGAPLPGGDLPSADFGAWQAGFQQRHAWLPGELALHFARCYGSRADELIGDARSLDDLGVAFGTRLYEREVRWLIDEEWAMTADDVLWRRTKHGLFMSDSDRQALADWMQRETAGHDVAASR